MKKMFAIVLALMLCVSALSVVAFAAEGDTVTVHAVVPEGWDAPNCYSWVEGVGATNWPGVAMTAEEGGWTSTIAADCDRVIINNNGTQTVDVTIEPGKEVWVTVTEEKDGDGKHIATVSYGTGATEDNTQDDNTQEDNTQNDNTQQTPSEVNYYVAGFAALCNGKDWDAGAAENVMTKGEDGTYSITYTGVAAGDYELKVTAGNWDTCWGNSKGKNVKFSISEVADITVKFNPETGKITVLNGANPITGDMSLAAVSVALLAATAGLVVTVSKKKEF